MALVLKRINIVEGMRDDRLNRNCRVILIKTNDRFLYGTKIVRTTHSRIKFPRLYEFDERWIPDPFIVED